MALLASKDATIHRAYCLFRTLMVHTDKSIQALSGKSASWKQKLRRALVGMTMEPGEIYEKTFQDFGVIYGTGTLIAPQYKVSAFDGATSSCLGHASPIFDSVMLSFDNNDRTICKIAYSSHPARRRTQG